MNKIKKGVQKRISTKANIFFNLLESCLQPLSRLAVRVFEGKRIRQITSLMLVAVVICLVVLPTSMVSAQTEAIKNSSNLVNEPEIVRTEKSIQIPVNYDMISQGFSFLHPGIDMAADKGTPVSPIMEGKIVDIEFGRFGFGNHVIIDHGSGFKSLYAHFSKIEVKRDEIVTKDSILGLVGSTGWSTGPHLHLQISQDDNWINPRVFLESYFGQKLAITR